MDDWDKQGLSWDKSGLCWDAATSRRKDKMSSPKLNLYEKTNDEVHAMTQIIITKMTGNPNFGTPNPPLLQLQTKLTASLAKTAAYNSAKQTLSELLSQRDDAFEDLCADLSSLASYVANTTTDATIIESAGMNVRSTPQPIGPLPAPDSLRCYAGNDQGVMEVRWSRVRGARSYQIEHTLNPNDPTSWVNHTSATRTDTTFTGLTSGQRMWFRARALGAAGPGDWSDPAVKTVP